MPCLNEFSTPANDGNGLLSYLFLKEEMTFFSQRKSGLLTEVKKTTKRTDIRRIELVIDSFSFDIASAIQTIKYLKSFHISYNLWIRSKAGSLATVLALGAEQVYISPYGSLAAIDPTFYMHGFPLVVHNGQPWHLNPYEFQPWVKFVNKIFENSSQAVKEFIEHLQIQAFSLESREKAKKHLAFLRQELLLITNPTYKACEQLPDYFLKELGSFDSCAYFTDLKKVGLSINLITKEQSSELRKLEKKSNQL